MFVWPAPFIFIATGFGAGIINALAGGGPILTLGVLSLTGIDPRIANLTSTVALSPGQLAAGYSLRRRLNEARLGQPLLLALVALAGGAIGAALLLFTASTTFRALVPWLVLIATALYAASGVPIVASKSGSSVSRRLSTASFSAMSLYGGYFGGGNSFLILALLGLTGHDPKRAGEIKNVLVAAINLGAVIVFALSGAVDWGVAFWIGIGGIAGSLAGTRLYGRLSATAVRGIVIAGGLVLAGWLFAT